MSELSGSPPLLRVRLEAHFPSSVPTELWLRAGDLVGRHSVAALPLHHPDAPLIAATVVRRGRFIYFEGAGRMHDAAQIRARRIRAIPGLVLPFPGCRVEVVEVVAPNRVLAVAVGPHPPQELVAPLYALVGGRRPDLLPGEVPSPDAIIVNGGASWRLSFDGGSFRPLEAGQIWQVHGTTLRTTWLQDGQSMAEGSHEPLTIEVLAGSGRIRISRPARHRVTLRGHPAEALRTLLMATLRPHAVRPASLTSLDLSVAELHYALHAHGIRPDLVRSDGMGGWELYLHAADRVQRTSGAGEPRVRASLV